MTAALFTIFFFGCKAAQSSNVPNKNIVKISPTATPFPGEIPQIEIKSEDVSSLEFRTVFKDFYDENSKCHKDYVEYFGREDGMMSPSSPCAVSLEFKRDGTATKTISIRRYDKSARETKEVEKTIWTAKISLEQFDKLAKVVTDDEGFKMWRDGMTITVSNASVSAAHPKGTRSMQMNLVKETANRVPLFNEFVKTDREIKWEKSQ